MIKKHFTVHSAVKGPVEVDATVAGSKVRANAPGAIIEFLAVDGSGSKTLRVLGSEPELDKILAAFPAGELVVATFAPAKTSEPLAAEASEES